MRMKKKKMMKKSKYNTGWPIVIPNLFGYSQLHQILRQFTVYSVHCTLYSEVDLCGILAYNINWTPDKCADVCMFYVWGD